MITASRQQRRFFTRKRRRDDELLKWEVYSPTASIAVVAAIAVAPATVVGSLVTDVVFVPFATAVCRMS
jgi:hypothetical protein